MEFIGRQIDFGVAAEASRGTAAAGVERWLRKVTANVVPRNERVVDDSSFGRLEDADGVRTVRKWNEGTVEGPLHLDPIGFLFLSLYGAVESTELDSYVSEHTFTLDQTIQHPTLSLFVNDGTVRSSVVAGGVVSELEIRATTNDRVRFSASFIGKQEDDVDSPEEGAVVPEYDFVSRDITIKVADTEAALEAATPIAAKSLSIKWNANVIPDYVFGNYSPADIYNGAFSLEFSFSRNYSDRTFETLYTGQDFKYVEIALRGEATLTDGSETGSIVITLNKVQVTNWTRTGAANELVTEDVDCKAFYNATDQQQSAVEVVNTIAAYGSGS